ncbi:hypothetical protein BD779DRAFT_1571524 [Infundibulicybe gibba]|nr:hypothetical protein BD779DRAFT_1571524 [Infundibulicybe gibba]
MPDYDHELFLGDPHPQLYSADSLISCSCQWTFRRSRSLAASSLFIQGASRISWARFLIGLCARCLHPSTTAALRARSLDEWREYLVQMGRLSHLARMSFTPLGRPAACSLSQNSRWDALHRAVLLVDLSFLGDNPRGREIQRHRGGGVTY